MSGSDHEERRMGAILRIGCDWIGMCQRVDVDAKFDGFGCTTAVGASAGTSAKGGSNPLADDCCNGQAFEPGRKSEISANVEDGRSNRHLGAMRCKALIGTGRL